MSLIEDLDARGLVFQVTDREALEKRLAEGPIAVYVGFDPTADSLHIGSLLPILTLRRFQLAGHTPIAVVGGATGLIGDPSGKKQERTLQEAQTVVEWTGKIQAQLARFIDFDAVANPGRVVNNYDWTEPLSVIAFLRDIGKNFSINTMLARESVSARLESGISFTEFSYMLLQSNDFLELFRRHGCLLQIGGSDQWGNIVGGVDLIRRLDGQQAFGLTIPLVTKADGTKFGKTESGAVWLDAQKTSVYQFYQFWLNTPDDDVIRFLQYFTFLSGEEITDLQSAMLADPGARLAQRTLAQEVTTMVHGADASKRAEYLSGVLFSGNIESLTVEEIRDVFDGTPSTTLPGEHARDLVGILVDAGICSSRRQAREDVSSGAISVNGERVVDVDRSFTDTALYGGEFLIVRRGKKKYFLVRFE
ncbi:MAG: tyrosine--tRNA ligase [Firmicutes bacterium]|nr:tyrosine--tRNA ligase [Bacillota bacterium]